MRTIIILIYLIFANNDILTDNYEEEIPHGDETPHGGIVVHANNGYSVEMLHSFKKVYFYLLEDDVTTVSNVGLSGELELIMKDKTKKKINVELSNDKEALKVVIEKKKNVKSYVINIKNKNQIITAKFK